MTELLKNNYNKVRELAPECMVLLKTDGSFPLLKKKKIALYGNGARYTLIGGTGGGIVEVEGFTTIEQGLLNAGVEITTAKWLDAYDELREQARKNHRASIKTLLGVEGQTALSSLSVAPPEPEYDLPIDGEGDVGIYILTRVSGEGADRNGVVGDTLLTPAEIRDIGRIFKKYSKALLVLNVSGVVDLSPVIDYASNVLLLSQLGSATGDAFADVILGKTYPSGKIASTWAKYGDYCRIGDWNPEFDTRYKEGIYIGYRYFDSVNIEPIFAFGDGLGYTQFSLQVGEVFVNGTEVNVPVCVKNIGKFKGKEVVQVYISTPWDRLDHPFRELVAFQKTIELAPENANDFTITFNLASIAAFDFELSSRILEKGDYILWVGNSLKNSRKVCSLRLDRTVEIERVSHVGGTPDFEDFIPNKKDVAVDIDLPILKINIDTFTTTNHTAVNIDEEALAFAKKLTDEQLCYLLTGKFVGEATAGGKFVPGAAGQSTDAFIKDGINTVVMADGPAGLHISGQYGIDENGVYAVVSEQTKAIKELLPPDILKYLLVMFPDAANDNRGGEIIDQYCTAIPIETALAQSWNDKICEICGNIVAEEMEEYGVDIHLAPALNMHRHPLCGRNFEYFSEDPYITGKMAVGVVRGVQSHSGKGSTLKHFVCNEQETNRLYSNSIVSERALRDIYMRGFEIAIKQAKPFAVMTSYNLLNGTHTSERADLIETVLRGEWGFDGTVVSDWVSFDVRTATSQKYPRACSSKTVSAGNDLMMPGSKGHYEELLREIKNKNSQLTREKSEICAARLISLAWKTHGE